MSNNVSFLFASSNKARRTPASLTFPRIINGNAAYAGAPELREDAMFPMSNALLSGRTGNVWAWDGTNGSNDPNGYDIILEVDIGNITSISASGMLGCARASGASFPQGVDVEYLPGVTYDATTGWLTYGSNVSTMVARDSGSVLPPVSARFWRYRLKNAAFGFGQVPGFSVASLVLQPSIVDIGFLYSGASERRIAPRTLVESYDRSPTITKIGNEYRRWSLRYDNNDAALRSTFDQLFSQSNPFVFITPDSEWLECVWDSEDFERSHIWAPPDRYRFTVELRSLT